MEITRGSIERLAAVRLYVLVDGAASPEEFERLVRSLIEAGVHAIQLRDKQLGDRELLARARLLRTLTQETQDAVHHQRPARPGGAGRRRRRSCRPGGDFGEGRPADRRARGAGGRFDP